MELATLILVSVGTGASLLTFLSLAGILLMSKIEVEKNNK